MTDIVQRANDWIVSGDTGVSSEAIWAMMMGARLGRRVFFGSHPHDPDDLGRCLRLLTIIPEWRPRLSELASVSPVWGALVQQWDALAVSMDAEVGIDWSKGRSAPKTYRLMRQIIERAEKAA